jgi:hypothetical protein
MDLKGKDLKGQSGKDRYRLRRRVKAELLHRRKVGLSVQIVIYQEAARPPFSL